MPIEHNTRKLRDISPRWIETQLRSDLIAPNTLETMWAGRKVWIKLRFGDGLESCKFYADESFTQEIQSEPGCVNTLMQHLRMSTL